MLTTSAHSVPSGADRSGQPAWRRALAIMLIALLSPVPALFAFWADASGDWLPDSWVDPASGHVFTLAELDAFSDDIDGDGLSNSQEMALGANPFSPDTDGDGISDLLDPLPLSTGNLSPANGIIWGAIALDDADGDGTPNFLDDYPYAQYGGQLETPDTDGDGIPNFIDPAPEDPYNTSPFNGLQWMGDALADADGDGVPNFHDWYPYDSSLWDPQQDPDGDGFVKARDPHPADPYNPSPVNGLNWGPDVYGDADGDGIPNFYDAYPYDSGNGYVPTEPDSDGDGIPDSVDPSPWDYDNFSAANGVSWQWDARGDADGDGISNFYDQFPYDYYNGNVPVSDMDSDGIPDAEDPAPTDPTNLSPINGGLWHTAALADADGDGNPNFTDPWPYDPTNGNLPPEWNSATADTDGDGIPNAQDPALADPLNFSIYNGTSWYGAAIGDVDGDGIANFRDEHPYDYYNGGYAGPDSDGDGVPDSSDPYPNDPNNGNGDADGDGIPDITDPAQSDPDNLSPINGYGWYGDVRGDADGDTILNFWDSEPYGPPPADADGDGLIDSVDPAPLAPGNFSAYNKASWSSSALGDADGDGIPNFFDTWPYDSLNGTGDADMDGLPDASDPVPDDPYNNSPHNGAMWSGPSALGDADNDGILNYFDAYPDDPYDGLPPGGDADGDGIPNEQDPDPRSDANTSPHNGINWGEGANGDVDGDGTANYWDYSPYGDDLDGDGLRDTEDPAPDDPTNYSEANQRAWYADALGDNDLDYDLNFYDPDPDGGMPYEPYLGEVPSASASQLVLLNDGYEELGEAPAPGVTPARDLDDPELAIKAGPRAGKMAISRLSTLNLSLPDEYLSAGGSVTFTKSGAGSIRLHAVRMVDGEGVEDRIIQMGVPYVPPNDGTWVHLIESVSGGGVTLTCHFPWMLYGQITGEHPSGVMSSDVVDILNLVSVEVVVRKKTETAAPETGLLVKKGDVITFDVNGPAPAGEFPFPPESVKWKVRQLKHDGTTTGWADIGGQGAELDFTTDQGGVFEAKAVVTPPGGQAEDYPLTRKKDAPHSDSSEDAAQDIHKAGAVDYFGVADKQWQIDLRQKALADLGSDKYKRDGLLVWQWWPYPRVASAGSNKCNFFVYNKCNDAGVPVSLNSRGVYGNPPMAIDWWNDNGLGKKDDDGRTISSIDIPGWGRLPDNAMPQPGLVVARPVLDEQPVSYSAHCGIFDYDGSWISAGAAKVNKYCHPKKYQPQGIRKYEK